MITQETVKNIEEIVFKAKQCGSLKETRPYIQELESLAFEERGYNAEKICDVKNALYEYCKANSDKSKTKYNLDLAIAKLNMCARHTNI